MPRVAQGSVKAPQILSQVCVGREAPEVSQLRDGNPGTRAQWSKLGHRAPRDGDRQSLAPLRAAKDLSDVVAHLLLRDRRHKGLVAKLLPAIATGAETCTRRSARVRRGFVATR